MGDHRGSTARGRGLLIVVGVLLGVLAGSPTALADPYYPNCDAARDQGVSSILRDDPGWRPGLTDGNDGIACREGRGPDAVSFVSVPPTPTPPPGTLPAGTVSKAMVLIVLGGVATVLLLRRERSGT
jgi:hypothetical protein